jgi:glycopeptide antibiotics resistance protein
VSARRRWHILPLWLLLPVLGLGSRSGHPALPSFVAEYAGDTLWTALVYVSLILFWPGLPISRALAISLGFSFLIELSQLYRAPWADALRANRFAALVLGRGFLASDLACYTVGALLSALADRLLFWRKSRE